ncbi:HAD family hydrolase [Candidatus Uabimicrobium sp. HlEnr_7]|uniref:HAD family hydrolase n=1 Tax=Candidatus Uabimicrobium helgolandensis TaxID=3095367 RepID=UPI003558389A
MKRLLLFDIDSTLILSKGIWGRCFFEAMQEVFPDVQKPQGLSFAGKTDLRVCGEILEYSNIPIKALEQNREQVLNIYSEKAHLAAKKYAQEVEILPGVIKLLQILQNKQDVVLTLLTGNIRFGAEAKLKCVDLHSFFDFEIGAWGDDHWDRNELPSIAISRAKNKLGISFSGKEIVVIGDTVHDINCGKSLGVRSIAVGTGNTEKSVLLEEFPDFYFDDLTDESGFLEAISKLFT